MKPKKLVKEYERALKAQPDNIAIRLKLAAALRQAGRTQDAIEAYRVVADTYKDRGRLPQAIAVCKSVLEFEPNEGPTQQLLDELGVLLERAAQEAVPSEAAVAAEISRPQVLSAQPQVVQPQSTGRPPGPRVTSPMPLPSPGTVSPAAAPNPPAVDVQDGEEEEEEEITGQYAIDKVLPEPPAQMAPPVAPLAPPRTASPPPHPGGDRKPGTTQPRIRVVFGDDPAKDVDDSFAPRPAFPESFAPVLDRLDDGGDVASELAVFSALPNAALLEMQRRMIVRKYTAGTRILREGDPGEACYVVLSGEVKVVKRELGRAHGDHVELGRLGPGELFGEFALLADRRRHASVDAVGDCQLYEIPRSLLADLATEFKGVGDLLQQLFRDRLLSTLLTTTPFFRPLTDGERRTMMSRFGAARVQKDETILREGEKGGGFYLVVLGTVKIWRKVDGKPTVLAALGDGSYFGEMSLLDDGVASATVQATTTVELAVLPPKDFYEILSKNPVLWHELRLEAKRRELANQDLLTGDTYVV